MTKYIEIHPETNRVSRVEDAMPSNTAEAKYFIECADDSVTDSWWLNPATDTLANQKTWTADEARDEVTKLLKDSDWMVLEDAPHFSHAAKLAAVKTYRQTLRDITSNDPILDEHFPIIPSLGDSFVE